MRDTETTSASTPPAEPPRDEAPVASPGGGAPVGTPSHAARSRLLRHTASLLLIVGGLVLAFPFWSSAYTRTQQGRLNDSYAAAATAFAADAAAKSARTARELPDQAKLERLAGLFEKRVKVGSAVARLKIPRIGFDRVVVQGTGGRDGLSPTSDQDLLRSGPVHYATTPLPGLGEPFAVAGHRTTYGAPFYHLNELKKGDPVYVETPYARFTYRVEKLSEVQPGDTSVLADRGYGLVLTTCTPLYSASRRLIVWAVAERFTLK